MKTPVNTASDNRRKQLRRWIEAHFAGVQTAFIASTNDGEKQINQGELSGLLSTKSFGERRARSLEKQAHMPEFYLEENHDKPTTVAQEPSALHDRTPLPTGWPFSRVSLRRVLDLKRSLGGRAGADAIHDIDEMLDLAVQKWERRAAERKSNAA